MDAGKLNIFSIVIRETGDRFSRKPGNFEVCDSCQAKEGKLSGEKSCQRKVFIVNIMFGATRCVYLHRISIISLTMHF